MATQSRSCDKNGRKDRESPPPTYEPVRSKAAPDPLMPKPGAHMTSPWEGNLGSLPTLIVMAVCGRPR